MSYGSDGVPDEARPPLEPIDYEAALRNLNRRRGRRKLLRVLATIPDLRPTSPGQVVLAGILAFVIGWLDPPLHPAMLVGTGLVIFGFASGFFEPRSKKVVWRNQSRVIPPVRRWSDTIYYAVYRHANN